MSNRRDFLKRSAAIGAGLFVAGQQSWSAPKAANDKLNVAFVGVGGMGGGNLNSVAGAGENVVGLCDIDTKRLDGAGNRHRKAKKFTDYRQMLEKLGSEIDAVVVSTPDHSHAPAGVMAMKMGKHLYCEKPLTYCVYEARTMRQTAAAKKVATCMGNRGTATDGFRRGVELIQSGALGDVKEVHVWTNRPGRWWKQGVGRPKGKFKTPNHVKWDLWVGPAPDRNYHPGLHPFAWRGWLDFGTGALGDMACHTMNLPFMGLKLGYPTSVTATSAKLNNETYPLWSTITYQFPARGDLPAVKVVWYDGMMKPGKQNLPPDSVLNGLKIRSSGALLIGSKGRLYSSNDYGSSQQFYTNDGKQAKIDYPKPTLARAPRQSQYLDWINACKGGKPALANFDYAALLTETVLLGNVSLRVGKEIQYDGGEMKVTNTENAAPFLKREYRKGWTL